MFAIISPLVKMIYFSEEKDAFKTGPVAVV